jgi:hypothetical protein
MIVILPNSFKIQEIIRLNFLYINQLLLCRCDVRLFLEILIHGDEEILTSSANSRAVSPLQHAIASGNVVFAQLLVWVSFFTV